MPRRLGLSRRRQPTDYAAIGKGERLRWSSGTILLAEDVTPVDNNPEARPPLTWESWGQWADVYACCRADFLADFHVRFPNGTPGAERLFKAFESGGDAGADAVSAELADEAHEEQRRLYALLGRD